MSCWEKTQKVEMVKYAILKVKFGPIISRKEIIFWIIHHMLAVLADHTLLSI
jgi:hypothetical protein